MTIWFSRSDALQELYGLLIGQVFSARHVGAPRVPLARQR
jgi:hypothetical protein